MIRILTPLWSAVGLFALTGFGMGFLLAMTPGEAYAEDGLLDIVAEDFDQNSHVIDNVWWPLVPGTQMTYRGHVTEAGERIEHLFVDTVTDLVKEIAGIRVLVSLEEDFQDGVLIEQEIAFHAQDRFGNVWHLGQLREVYDEVELVGGRVWVVGAPAGAKAGIRMEAVPGVGNAEYSQGYAPAPFNWTDRARVSEAGVVVGTPAGRFEGVIVIDEHDAETEDGVFQTKYYARGVGLVRVGFRGPDPQEEELLLTQIEHLDDATLARANATALEIEARGYLYNATTPAKQFE